ncbi:putative RNA methyltransferase At5g10620 isoform X3 [Musa acuminata AAA Group]|uniref:putative RNA methyltransferase At5g10620 isoform X3 n=1 Tax=Musa acuminata AAA Group TaxID=214697 RepID=UPI0031DF4D3B
MEVSRWSQCYAVFSQMKKNTSAPLLARKSKYSGQSIRAIPIRILTVGKRRSPGVQLLVEEYMEKLSNVKAQIDAEDMVIMQQIRHEDWVVVLDEHGLDVGSVQLADLLGDAGRTGSTRLAFCIGGPYGHGPQLRNRADVTIRLSSMVLNHQIALIVLLEQLYRVSINRPVEAGFLIIQKKSCP